MRALIVLHSTAVQILGCLRLMDSANACLIDQISIEFEERLLCNDLAE